MKGSAHLDSASLLFAKRAKLGGVRLSLLTVMLVTYALAAAESPLADAVEKQQRVKIQALLEQNAGVTAAQVDGMTALHWAAYLDDLDTAKLLIKAGADARATNRYGVAP